MITPAVAAGATAPAADPGEVDPLVERPGGLPDPGEAPAVLPDPGVVGAVLHPVINTSADNNRGTIKRAMLMVLDCRRFEGGTGALR